MQASSECPRIRTRRSRIIRSGTTVRNFDIRLGCVVRTSLVVRVGVFFFSFIITTVLCSAGGSRFFCCGGPEVVHTTEFEPPTSVSPHNSTSDCSSGLL